MGKKIVKLTTSLLVTVLFFVSFNAKAQTATPGGVANPNYVWTTWLTPDSYSNGTWTNQITTTGTLGDFVRLGTAPVKAATGYNFHRPVNFTSHINRLLSQNNNSIANGDNVTVILVMQRNGQPQAYQRILNFGTGTDNAFHIWYYLENGPFFAWNSTANYFPTSATSGLAFPDGQAGVYVASYANQAVSDRLRRYINGSLTLSGSTNISVSANTNKLLIASQTTAGSNGFNGAIYELIVLKANGTNNHINYADLQQINSYLCIKYGFMLNNTDDYVVSGDTVWNRATNSGFNNNIFGIARSDNAGLYQKQSKAKDADILTLFVGSAPETLNSQNTGTLSDGQFLMLGSNNAKGIISYPHIPNAGGWSSGNNTSKLNFRSNQMWKAQVTFNGAGSSSTVNMQVNYVGAAYVLVCPDASFSKTNTRIYPINNKIAVNVLINDGDYVALAGFAPTPGGIDMGAGSYLLDLWIDGNNATGNSWSNLAYSEYSLERFATNAPTVQNSRFNFNREMNFSVTNSKLRTTVDYERKLNEAYYYFVVSDATVGTLGTNNVLLSFNNAPANSTLRWHNSSSNILTARWTTTAREPGFTQANYQRYGIAAMNFENRSSGLFNMYLNGTVNTNTLNLSTTVNGNGPSTGAQRLIIGNASTVAATNSEPFRGTIQEIILVRKTSAATQMPQQQIEQIHSYLAIKYGITLSHNYRNTAGTVVWDRTANTGYNNCIFGIARDDASGLYQKQSQSVNFTYFTAFTGNNITTLNSQNNGTLSDMQYLMIGSDGSAPVKPLDLNDSFQSYTTYANGGVLDVTTTINIKSGVFKAQLTGASSMTVKLAAPSNDYTHVLISNSTSFTTATSKIYPVANRIAEVEIDQVFKYILFIGFDPGPGGVNAGLRLWLRADNYASLDIDNLAIGGDSRLNGFPSKFYKDPNNVPAVLAWKDLVRGHTYSLSVASDANRAPVMMYNSPEMNFYPAVRFWSDPNNLSTTSAYLANSSGIMKASDPTQPAGHTTIFLTNQDFAHHNTLYNMLFSSSVNFGNYNGPGYGVYYNAGQTHLRGRFRTSGGERNGTDPLFPLGNTTISSYIQSGTSITFRFNSLQETRTFVWGNFSMKTPSKIGSGYNAERTIQGVMSEVIIFDRVLDSDELNAIGSYMAFKYGITLRPNTNSTGRYSYRFSDATTVWDGDLSSGKYVDFYNRITTVIRDDAARLHNRQSHSTDVGSLLRMGVAGTMLTDDGAYLGSLDNNLEAVVWGDNNDTGSRVITEEHCGDYESIFNRVWLVRKITQGNRPISMLVGAENNNLLTIGNDAGTIPYYNVLIAGYNVYLVVADSPADIAANNFKAVIPMNFINNIHQCNYVFSEDDTYITFAYKANGKGCPGSEDAEFDGIKTLDWTQYTATTNRSTGYVSQIPATSFTVDLGDNIIATTFVTYDSPVRATRGYPRAVTMPSRGSLELRRSRGSTANNVFVNMRFNNPVIPSFSISGIDGRSRSYDKIQLGGACSSGAYLPSLSYASGPNSSTAYTINGAIATANRNAAMPASNLNGRMNVAFDGGVEEVTLKYNLTNRAYGTQSIYISPVTLQAALPMPPIDEAGISFVQTAMPPEVSLCKEVTYTYKIESVNHEDKRTKFYVELPAGMKWLDQSLALNPVNKDALTLINNYENTNILQIDSLIIVCGEIATFSATAYFEDTAEAGTYTNRAYLYYDHFYTYNDSLARIARPSCDGLTKGCVPTAVKALHGTQLAKLQLEILDFGLDKPYYMAGDTINVVLKVNNPNTIQFADVALDISFNEEFRYVDGSFDSTIPNVPDTILSDIYDDFDEVEELPSGKLAREDGVMVFIAQPIPPGINTISFKLAAPAGTGTMQRDYDDAHPLPTGITDENGCPLYVDLDVDFNFFTLPDDECIAAALADANGYRTIPALTGVTPAVTITVSENNVCAGTSVIYTVSSTNNAGLSPTYQWLKNGVPVGTTSTYSYTPTNGDVISCEMTSSESCTSLNPAASNAITMTVKPLRRPSITITAVPD